MKYCPEILRFEKKEGKSDTESVLICRNTPIVGSWSQGCLFVEFAIQMIELE